MSEQQEGWSDGAQIVGWTAFFTALVTVPVAIPITLGLYGAGKLTVKAAKAASEAAKERAKQRQIEKSERLWEKREEKKRQADQKALETRVTVEERLQREKIEAEQERLRTVFRLRMLEHMIKTAPAEPATPELSVDEQLDAMIEDLAADLARIDAMPFIRDNDRELLRKKRLRRHNREVGRLLGDESEEFE